MIPAPAPISVGEQVANLFGGGDSQTIEERNQGQGIPIYNMNDDEDDIPVNLPELEEYYAENEATDETPLNQEDLQELGIKNGPEITGKQEDDNPAEPYEPIPTAEEPNEISEPEAPSFTKNLQDSLNNLLGSQLESNKQNYIPQNVPSNILIPPKKPQEKSNLPMFLMIGIPVGLLLVLLSQKNNKK